MFGTLVNGFNGLSSGFEAVFSRVTGSTKATIDETALQEVCKQLRRILLDADVSVPIAQRFLVRFKEKVLGQKIYDGLDAEQYLFGLLHESITELLGTQQTLLLEKNATQPGVPKLILLFGLQGSGKTTTAGKLVHLLLESKQAKKPLLVAADTHRPAAAEQLAQLAKRLGVTVYQDPTNPDMQAIVEAGLALAAEQGHDVVVVDTAGRQEASVEAMADLLLLERSIKPDEKLLVIDAMLGQQAITVANAFHAQLHLTGLVLTKLDGDARGGAVLSVVEATGCPIKLVGVGEGLEDLEPFYPERMAGRLLGHGDMLSLFEKAKNRISEQETKRLQDRMFNEPGMNFSDFLSLQSLLSRLGSMDQILGMLPIPGLSNELKQQLSGEAGQKNRKFKALFNSMTLEERNNPDVLAKPRLERVAKGCGLTYEEAEAELKPFYYQRHMMLQMGGMLQFFKGGNNPFAANEPATALATSNATPTKRSMGYDPLTGKVFRKK